jgi:hypothetical protein
MATLIETDCRSGNLAIGFMAPKPGVLAFGSKPSLRRH